MHPAFSVIFLTTLIGAGQGLLLAMSVIESTAPSLVDHSFYVCGSMLSLLLITGGLVASFFHLGHPERAWRAASQWRTSWLSREVILLPLMMASVAAYGLGHYLQLDYHVTQPLGLIGSLVALLLFGATGMIYACLRFLREWATPLTVINFTLLGSASGFLLATALAAWAEPMLTNFLASCTVVLIAMACIGRVSALIRNARLKPKVTLQSAIGIRHSKIQQKAMGAMGGTFNTREFFHHKSRQFIANIKWISLLLVFLVPLLLIWLSNDSPAMLTLAFAIQYLGLIAERWLFFAQANHPQNLYYQTV